MDKDNKKCFIARKSDDGLRVLYWQGYRWWSEFKEDAERFTEEEAKRHEEGFNQSQVVKVFIVQV